MSIKFPLIKGEKKPIASISPNEMVLSGDKKYINPIRNLKISKPVVGKKASGNKKNPPLKFGGLF